MAIFTGEKIGYLVSSFPYYSETFILNEMDALERLGFSLCCFSLTSNSDDTVHHLAKKWITRVHWPPLPLSKDVFLAHLYSALAQPRKYFYALRHYRNYGGKRNFLIGVYLARVVAREKIRHIHAQFGWCAPVAMLIAHLSETGFSFILHGADIFYVPPANMAQLVNCSKFCVTISKFNKKYLLSQWQSIEPEKVQVLHCGIDTDKFLPTVKSHVNYEPIKLLTVARLVKLKNIPLLISICENLCKQGLEYTCKIVGDGPERTDLEEQIRKLGLEKQITLKGVISQENLVSIYQNADIYLLTSISEGIPVTVMEAFASGLPVIAPNITGMSELVIDGQNGFLFPEGNPDRAVDAIIRVAEDSGLRTKMGIRGREKVLKEYNIHTNAGQLAGMFAEVLEVKALR